MKLIYKHRKWLLPSLAGILLAFVIARFGITATMIAPAIALVLLFIHRSTKQVKIGFYALMAANFLSTGLTRYLPLPLGLTVDLILVFIFLVIFFKEFKEIDWTPVKNPVFLLVGIWMLVNLFELLNPEARSFEAWFYAMRGVGLYFFLTLLVGYLLLQAKQDFSWFIHLWFLFSILGTLWGMRQLFIGLDGAEKLWLSVEGNRTTHLLFGKLRVFSYFSDAGQFGASQAHTAVVAAILAIHEKIKKRKFFYVITALLGFYGMLISGTRGAFSIPLIGFTVYLMLVKNFKVISIGVLLMAVTFFFLKFTFVGQGNYEIRRLRSALDPNDASLNVRIENQKRLGAYLDQHPFGGGVGSAGYWGQRFSPDTFLARLALDSWYVRIAAEFGYVGLVYYLAMLLFILYYAIKTIRLTLDEAHKFRLFALLSGFCGILVASYGNQVFGQLPTAICLYISIVFLTSRTHITHAA